MADDGFVQMLVAVLGFALFLGGSALVMFLVVTIDRTNGVQMSQAWLNEQKAIEVRTVATLEHELVIGGEVVLTHPDEKTVLAVREEMERLR